MDVKARKNEYQHDVVDCPFCDYFAYVRPVTKVSPDPLRDLKRHITNQAKNEAFIQALVSPLTDETNHSTPHLDYYKQHTSEPKLPPRPKARQYDEDLKLK